MTQSHLDNCTFYSRKRNGELKGVIAFHVDDLLIGGCQEFYNEEFERLKGRYSFKHVKHGEGEFLGKMLKQNEDFSIGIQQREYAETLKCIQITKKRRKEKEQETNSIEKLRCVAF